jgi:hypothetical protein
VSAFDLGHDAIRRPHLLPATWRGDDELGPPVGGVGQTLHVPERLQLVDESADDLLVPAGEPGQLGRPDPLPVQASTAACRGRRSANPRAASISNSSS